MAVENPAAPAIEPIVGRVIPRGTARVTPSATTTYTLTNGDRDEHGHRDRCGHEARRGGDSIHCRSSPDPRKAIRTNAGGQA